MLETFCWEKLWGSLFVCLFFFYKRTVKSILSKNYQHLLIWIYDMQIFIAIYVNCKENFLLGNVFHYITFKRVTLSCSPMIVTVGNWHCYDLKSLAFYIIKFCSLIRIDKEEKFLLMSIWFVILNSKCI